MTVCSRQVTVSARTLIGEGPPSMDALVRTRDDIPGRPSRLSFTLVSPTEARLKFFPPEDPNGVITVSEQMHKLLITSKYYFF